MRFLEDVLSNVDPRAIADLQLGLAWLGLDFNLPAIFQSSISFAPTSVSNDHLGRSMHLWVEEGCLWSFFSGMVFGLSTLILDQESRNKQYNNHGTTKSDKKANSKQSLIKELPGTLPAATCI